MTDRDDAFVLEPVKRIAVFEALLSGSASRSDLQDVLDVSRATLHRIVTFLTDEGLAEERDGTLALTPLGRVVAEEATDYVDQVRTARRLAPLVNGIDVEAVPFDLDLALFADASVTRPKPGQPQRPAQRVVDVVEDADRVRAFGPVILPIYVEVFYREILGGMATELVIEPDVLDGLEAEYADKFTEAADTGNLDALVHGDLPFGLVLTPERVGVVGYDGDDVARILVESDDDEFVAWAESVYERYREEATAFDDG